MYIFNYIIIMHKKLFFENTTRSIKSLYKETTVLSASAGCSSLKNNPVFF